MCSFKLNKSLYLFKFAIYVLITSRLPIFYKLYCSFLIFFILYRNINNAYKKNYESDKEHYLNASRDYYNYNKEYILKKQKINIIIHMKTKIKNYSIVKIDIIICLQRKS